MVHAVVVTHGMFGEELIRSAEMIAGEITGVDSVPLLQEDNPAGFEAKVRKVLGQDEKELLFLADIYGGTPYNTAASLLKSYDAWIVTGINLGMILELATTLGDVETAEEMAVNLMETSTSTCRMISRASMTSASQEDEVGEEEDL